MTNGQKTMTTKQTFNEEIIKRHAPDWVRWHDHCKQQVLNAMAEKDTIIVYNSEIPILYGNLKTLCEDLDVSYSTYSKKQFPFNIGNIEVLKIEVKRGHRKAS